MGETRKVGGHAAVVLLFAAVALGVLLALFKLSGSLSLGGTYEVKAIVPQAGSLTQGTSVTMAGARVGVVKSVERRGVGALVDIRIDDDSVKPLPKDSTAQLAVRTPLGENYVELIPGRSKEDLENGGLVEPRRGAEYVDVDQILSVLKGRTRDRARKMFVGLGATVDGKGPQLQRALHSTGSILQSGSGLTARLKGDKEQVGDLVLQLGRLGSAIGDRDESIRVLSKQGVVAFRAIAARDSALRDTISELPGTLEQVKQTTSTLRSVSDQASPVVSNLAVALREVRPAARSLAPAASSGRGVVSSLDKAAPRLEDTLDAIEDNGTKIAKVLPKADGAMCQLNPALDYFAPYWDDFVNFLTGLGAASNSYDAVGHTIRLLPVVGENSLLGAPKPVADAAFELSHAGALQTTQGLSFDPYPKPGTAADSYKPGDPQRKGPEDIAPIFKYQRIQRAC